MIRMKRCVLGLALLVPAAIAQAQEVQITPYGAMSRGLDGAPALVGLGMTWHPGPLGLRLSGALDGPSSPAASLLPEPTGSPVRAWTADADLVLSLRRAGLEVGSVDLSPFAGVGLHGRSDADAGASTLPVWSYGLGLGVPLA
jgi:hypothetical protein